MATKFLFNVEGAVSSLTFFLALSSLFDDLSLTLPFPFPRPR